MKSFFCLFCLYIYVNVLRKYQKKKQKNKEQTMNEQTDQ